MKKIYKTISICIIVLMMIFIYTDVFAADLIIQTTDAQKDLGTSTSSMKNMANIVFGFISVIGSIVSVAMLVIIGIKYMFGSASEKAEYKKTMMPYLIGAILLFGASNFAKIVYDFAMSL